MSASAAPVRRIAKWAEKQRYVIVPGFAELYCDNDLGEERVAITASVETEAIRTRVKVRSEVFDAPVVVGDA
jgi:hypothetical protein